MYILVIKVSYINNILQTVIIVRIVMLKSRSEAY